MIEKGEMKIKYQPVEAPIRPGATQSRDEMRNFSQNDLPSLNSTEVPSCHVCGNVKHNQDWI
jgi:hypothetical protein